MTRIRFDGRDLFRSPLSPLFRAPVRSPAAHPTPRGGRSRRVGARAWIGSDSAARPARRRPPLPLHRRPPRARRPGRVRRRGAGRRRGHHPAAGQGRRTARWRRAPSWPRWRCWPQACARHGALLAVNDRADVALAAGADVLHLGQDDLPVEWARKVVGGDLVIGRSAHSADETATAADEAGSTTSASARAGRPRPSRAGRRPDWTWCARWPAGSRPGRGSPSAESTTTGWTRCSTPAPAASSWCGRSPRQRIPRAAATAVPGPAAPPTAPRRRTRDRGARGSLRRPAPTDGALSCRARPGRGGHGGRAGLAARLASWEALDSADGSAVLELSVDRRLGRGRGRSPPWRSARWWPSAPGSGSASSSAGARSSTRPTEVPSSPRVRVEPLSSSSPVTTSRPSTNTTTVAPIQRPHGRFGGGSGDVAPPVPSRRVGPPPAPTWRVGASPSPTRRVGVSPPSTVVAGSPGRPTGGISVVGWPSGPVGIRGIGMVTSASAAAAVAPAASAVAVAARRRRSRSATVSWVRLSECS